MVKKADNWQFSPMADRANVEKGELFILLVCLYLINLVHTLYGLKISWVVIEAIKVTYSDDVFFSVGLVVSGVAG